MSIRVHAATKRPEREREHDSTLYSRADNAAACPSHLLFPFLKINEARVSLSIIKPKKDFSE